MADLNPLAGTPFGDMLILALVLAALCWLFSVLTREYSWVDRIWSICPPIYCIWVAWAADFDSARLNLMAALVTLWGARLTFNFVRKGGYWKGGEDYRWETVKERTGPVGFQVLNATFIAPGQMILIWWFTAPIHTAWQWQDAPFTWMDAALGALFLTFLIGETVADEQMWAFQQDKQRKLQNGEDAEPFLRTGLYRYSRHPNYFCELGMWWTLYLFAVTASGEWLHWTGWGFILLTLLFHSSTNLAETISSGKYPSYKDYQASVPRLIPIRLGRPSA